MTAKKFVLGSSTSETRRPRLLKAVSLLMVDAIFAGNHDDPGWVEMDANDKGPACVDALFPEVHIAWRGPGNGAPADWHGFIINIPDVVDPCVRLSRQGIRNAWVGGSNPFRGTNKIRHFFPLSPLFSILPKVAGVSAGVTGR